MFFFLSLFLFQCFISGVQRRRLWPVIVIISTAVSVYAQGRKDNIAVFFLSGPVYDLIKWILNCSDIKLFFLSVVYDQGLQDCLWN